MFFCKNCSELPVRVDRLQNFMFLHRKWAQIMGTVSGKYLRKLYILYWDKCVIDSMIFEIKHYQNGMYECRIWKY